MEGKSCFFIGHRDAPEGLYPQIEAAVEKHITEYGVETFFVGHYGSFDRMAARAVRTAKRRDPAVTLFLVLPYHPFERPVPLPEGFDGTYYPEGTKRVPHRAAILRANRYMVTHVEYLIAYACYPGSNARELVDYARRREKRGLMAVCNLGDEMTSMEPQNSHKTLFTFPPG